MSILSLARVATGLLFLYGYFFAPAAVLARQSPPQVQLNVSEASPGATVEISGGRFPEDALVEILIQNAGQQVTFGSFLADDHGEFLIPITLPLELPYGEYEIRVTDEKNQTAAAPLRIVPDPNQQGGSGERDDSDGLLAPMPTYAPGVSSTALPPGAPANAPVSGRASAPWIAAIVLGVGILLFFGMRFLRAR